MATSLKPIRKQSVSDAVFEQLRDQILEGGLDVGSTLPAERVLCEILGVNRGALREALKRLEQANLVDIQHGTGATVLDYRRTAGMDLLAQLLVHGDGQVDTDVARSVVEMRSAIGPDAARLAAMRNARQTGDALFAIVDAMGESVDDLNALQNLSLDFWQALVEGSDNVAYRLSQNTLRRTYDLFRHLMVGVLADELNDLRTYRAIARAVCKGDGATAERRAAALLARGADPVFELLEAIDSARGELQ